MPRDLESRVPSDTRSNERPPAGPDPFPGGGLTLKLSATPRPAARSACVGTAAFLRPRRGPRTARPRASCPLLESDRMRLRLTKTRSLTRLSAGLALCLSVAACGTVLLNQTGSLTRYDRLKTSDEATTTARPYADPSALARTRTVRIVPTAFPESISGPGITAKQRKLVANAADRALCYELSLRYDVVSGRDADLTVRAAVTRVELTGLSGAGATI